MSFNGQNSNEQPCIDRLKIILYLPFEPVWFIPILIATCCAVMGKIYSAGFRDDHEILDMDYVELCYQAAYLFDTVLIIVCKNYPNLDLPPTAALRPNIIIILDVLSTLPLRFILPATFNNRIFIAADLLTILKLGRIYFYFKHYSRLIGNNRTFFSFVNFFLYVSICCLATSSVLYTILCRRENCIENPLYIVTIASMHVTGAGQSTYPENLEWLLFSTVVIFATDFFKRLTIGNITNNFLWKFYNRFAHLYKLKQCFSMMRLLKVPNVVFLPCQDYFDETWRTHEGFSDEDLPFGRLFPFAMYREIVLDVCWDALKHCRLFRKKNLSFLRYISTKIKQEYLLADDILIQENEFKNKMIYLKSGVIQILSEEDGETPVLSLSGGTCIGSASLFIGYKSTVTVRCKTVCELHVLSRKDLLKLSKYFPNEFRSMKKEVESTFATAKENEKLSILTSTEEDMTRKRRTTIMWLKNTLHRLMVKDGDTLSKHQCQNIFLLDDVNEYRYTNTLFTAKYLDMLAISERIALVTDTMFLRVSCPCILQPDSLCLNVWNVIINVLVLAMGFIIPYYAFIESNTPEWYTVFVTIITFVWLLDIYVAVSTAVKTKDNIIANVVGIFLHRVNDVKFWLDLLATFPLEILSCLLLNTSSTQSRCCMYLNRILKLYKILIMFGKLEERYHTTAMTVRYIKFGSVFFYIIFLGTCGIYSINCFDYQCVDDTFKAGSVWYLLAATQVITGIGFESVFQHRNEYNVFYIIFMMLFLFFFVLIFSSFSASYALDLYYRNKLRNVINDGVSLFKQYNLDAIYKHRFIRYINWQWAYDKGAVFLDPKPVLANLPIDLHKTVTEIGFASIMKGIPLLQHLSEEVIYELCSVVTQTFIPNNAMVCYTGELGGLVYVIDEGFCGVLTPTGEVEQLLGPKDYIGIVEGCFGIPVINTVLCLTDVKLISFSFDNLVSFMLKYHEQLIDVKEILKDKEVRKILEKLTRKGRSNIRYTVQKKILSSFHKFGYNLELDSPEEYDYHIPFDMMNCFGFVRYLLLRYTIIPDSGFLYKWELFRCVCAALSAIVFTNSIVGTCYDCYWIFFRIFLDFVAWLDIYLRLHVCYYNEKAILVSHPLKTACHYITHGMFLDLLAVFPIHFFIRGRDATTNRLISLMQLNRVIQMHRYYGFFNYIKKKTVRPEFIIYLMEFLPYTIILSWMTGSLIINMTCDFDFSIPASTNFSQGVSCAADSWITNSQFDKPIGPYRAQIIGFYFATTIYTLSGSQGFKITTTKMASLVTFLSIIGFLIYMGVMTKVMAMYATRNSTLVSYQQAMQIMRKFLIANKIHFSLKTKLINHFEYTWLKNRGQNVHNTVKKFRHSIRNDLLLDIFGKVLTEYTIFNDDSIGFFRNVLNHMKHELCMKGSYLATVNDINTNLHIVFKGNVDVIAPDGSKLTSLSVGGIFGNLDNCPMTRQTISAIASVNVEILSIESVKFHNVLAKFPRQKHKFQRCTALHLDYITGIDHSHDVMESTSTTSATSIDIPSQTHTPYLLQKRVFDPKSNFILAWNVFILLVVCYFAVALELYRIALLEFHIILLVFQYVCDFLYILDFFIKNRIAYYDEYGTYINDIKLIKANRFQNKRSLRIAVFCLIPLDVIVWFPPMDKRLRFMLVNIFRLNRLPRVKYVYRYFLEENNKLNINVYYMRILFILTWVLFSLHFLTCLLLFFGCIDHEINMVPKMKCERFSLTVVARLEQYFTYLQFIVICFTAGSPSVIVPSSLLVIVYVIAIMQITLLMTAVFCGQIFTAIQTLRMAENDFTYSLDHVHHFMKRELVSVSLLGRVYNHLRLLWISNRGYMFPPLVLEAPRDLRDAVMNAAFAHHIANHLVFKDCHVDFIRQMVAHFHCFTYCAGENIIFVNDMNNSMYFIHYGEVNVVSESSSQTEYYVEQSLVQGQCFGIRTGLLDLIPQAYTCRCLKNSVILVLRKHEWSYLLDFFPASKESIYENLYNYFQL